MRQPTLLSDEEGGHFWSVLLCAEQIIPDPWSQTDCGGLTLAGCQVPTKSALSLPLLSWTGERKYNERLVG